MPGATLFADASALRVLRTGAKWVYRGVEQLGTSIYDVSVYSNTVTHAFAAAGVEEQATNLFNGGPTTTVVRFQGGQVTQPLDLSALIGSTIDAVELRSPVRAGDQYTILDRTIVDSIDDLDGDGRRESIDIAAWTVVKGTELVQLMQRHDVQAVLVVTTTLARARLTSNGQVSEPVAFLQSIWYAPGIGIVKQQIDIPDETIPSRRHVATEELLEWNGVTEGIGSLGLAEGVAPADSPLAGQMLGRPVEAVSFGSHGVVRVIQLNEDVLSLASLDSRGRVTAARSHEPEVVNGAWLVPLALAATDDGVRVVSRGVGGLMLQSFDRTGQQRLATPPVSLFAGPFASTEDGVAAAATGRGNRLWLMWLKYDVQNNQRTLMLRGFDSSGNPISPEIELTSQGGGSTVSRLVIVANETRAVAAWTESLGPRHYVVLDNASGAVLARRVMPDGATYAVPFAADNHLGFVSERAAVWQLDSDFSPLVPAGERLESELLALGRAGPVAAGVPFVGGDTLFVTGSQATVLWPEDGSTFVRSFYEVFELPLAPGRTAAYAQPQWLFRQPLQAENFNVTHTLLVGDRPLVIGYNVQSHQLLAHPVWR
jgi:hypothetical protein